MRVGGRSVAALLLVASHAAAQSGPVTDGPPITRIPVSTRAAGLGGAGAALTGHAAILFVNPAALATIGRLGVEVGYQRHVFDASVASGALAVRLGQFHWAGGVHVLDYGSEPVVVQGAETGQTIHPWEGIASSGLVYRFGVVAVGAAGKYVRQDVDDVVNDGYAADAGVAIAVFDIMALGASMQNVAGGDIGAAGELPRTTRLGFTFNYVDPQGTLRLLTTVEGIWTAGRGGRGVLGAEGGIVVEGIGLEGRAALATRRVPSDVSRLSLGGGIRLGSLTFDYAFQDLEVGGMATHRFGLRWTP